MNEATTAAAVHWIDRFDQLHPLLERWRAQNGDADPHIPVTQTPTWCEAMWFRYGPRGGFLLAAIFHGETLAAVLPLRRLGRRRGTEYLQGLCEIAPAYFAANHRNWTPLLLHALTCRFGRWSLMLKHQDGGVFPTATFLNTAAQAPYFERVKTHHNTVIDLSGGWQTYRAGLSKNTREGLRKAKARLRKDGVRMTTTTATHGNELRTALLHCLCVDSQSWKFQRGGAMCWDHGEDGFFVRLLEGQAAVNRALVFTLALDDFPCAFILGFRSGRRAYLAIWTYAAWAGHYMPGKLLMAYALEMLAGLGVVTVDTWGRHDAFKASWSKQHIVRHDLVLANPSRRARFAEAGRVLVDQLPLNRLRGFLFGGNERYRLKNDRPGFIEQRLLHPLQRGVTYVKKRSRCRALKRPDPLVDELGIQLRPETNQDRFRLHRVAEQEPGGERWTFVCGDQILGGISLRLFPTRNRRLVTDLRFLIADLPRMQACLYAVFRYYPGLRVLYEPAFVASADGGCSLQQCFPTAWVQPVGEVLHEPL